VTVPSAGGETDLSKKKRAAALEVALGRAYPEARCSLDYQNPFQLWVATVLSAQCTDSRVNLITPALFRRCPDALSLSTLSQEEVEALIRPTGFFRNKAKSLRQGAALLLTEFSGQVPDTMESLLRIPGVARKTANVLLGNAFGKAEGFVVDTHVLRLALRLGLTARRDPVRIERDLMTLFPRERWTSLSHRLIQHGRQVCKARRPACERCPLTALCPRVGLES